MATTPRRESAREAGALAEALRRVSDDHVSVAAVVNYMLAEGYSRERAMRVVKSEIAAGHVQLDDRLLLKRP